LAAARAAIFLHASANSGSSASYSTFNRGIFQHLPLECFEASYSFISGLRTRTLGCLRFLSCEHALPRSGGYIFEQIFFGEIILELRSVMGIFLLNHRAIVSELARQKRFGHGLPGMGAGKSRNR
jgi:hypothetical protein